MYCPLLRENYSIAGYYLTNVRNFVLWSRYEFQPFPILPINELCTVVLFANIFVVSEDLWTLYYDLNICMWIVCVHNFFPWDLALPITKEPPASQKLLRDSCNTGSSKIMHLYKSVFPYLNFRLIFHFHIFWLESERYSFYHMSEDIS